MEDVIAWLLHVAKRNNIPYEDLEIQKFASCTGTHLLQMNEEAFKIRDSVYGSLIFREFRRLLDGWFYLLFRRDTVSIKRCVAFLQG